MWLFVCGLDLVVCAVYKLFAIVCTLVCWLVLGCSCDIYVGYVGEFLCVVR